jgi:hypothetical protein
MGSSVIRGLPFYHASAMRAECADLLPGSAGTPRGRAARTAPVAGLDFS